MPIPPQSPLSVFVPISNAIALDDKATSTVGADVRDRVATLISSDGLAFTYGLVTQLLGKLTDHRLDALCLQRGGDNAETRWDARSLASSVVVPWVRENQNVLGTSADPYVSNPLRQPRILPNPPNVKAKTLSLWGSLHSVWSEVQDLDDPAYTLEVFRAVLLAVNEKLRSQQFDYPVLRRVSVEQTMFLVRGLLDASQAGEHAMSVATALLTVVGQRFHLWDDIRREQSTTADRASGMVGDIECRKNGCLVFAAEVKEQRITLADVRSFEAKLDQSDLTEALLSAPSVHPQDADQVAERMHLIWTRGINLYHHPLEQLVAVAMSLAGEPGRCDFIAEVGKQLDAHARTSGRLAWRALLERVISGERGCTS